MEVGRFLRSRGAFSAAFDWWREVEVSALGGMKRSGHEKRFPLD